MQVLKCPLYFDLVTGMMGQVARTEHGLSYHESNSYRLVTHFEGVYLKSEGHFSVFYLQKIHVHILQYVLL